MPTVMFTPGGIRGSATDQDVNRFILSISIGPMQFSICAADLDGRWRYTRRRPTSECFNGEQYERKVIKNPCECTEEDYECEFGFRRKVRELPLAIGDASLQRFLTQAFQLCFV